MTTSKSIDSSLSKTLNSSTSLRYFKNFDRPTLARFQSPADAAEFLKDNTNPAPERSRLTLELVRLAREGKHSLWNSILTAGFVAPLWTLCKAAARDIGDDDAVGIVFAEFTAAIREYCYFDKEFFAPNLLRYTRRAVSEHVRRVVSENERYEQADDEALAHEETPERLSRNRRGVSVLVSEVAELAKHESFENVVALVAPGRSGRSLREWVTEELPGASKAETARRYIQLRDRRFDTICRIRSRLNGGRARALELLPAD